MSRVNIETHMAPLRVTTTQKCDPQLTTNRHHGTWRTFQCPQRVPDVANTNLLTQSQLDGGRTRRMAVQPIQGTQGLWTQESPCICRRCLESRRRETLTARARPVKNREGQAMCPAGPPWGVRKTSGAWCPEPLSVAAP